MSNEMEDGTVYFDYAERTEKVYRKAGRGRLARWWVRIADFFR